MKVTVIKSKKVAAFIAIVAYSISSFAQVSTMYVMKNGEVVFETSISGVDNVTFDEATPDKALIVHKNDGSPTDKILLNNIQRLSFLDGNLSAEISNGNETYMLSDIAKFSFDNITTGINNLPTQSDFEIFVTPAGDVIIKSSVAIKLLTLFGIDGRVISIQQYSGIETQCTISLRDSSVGVYLLRVETEQGAIVKKVVKQLNK